MGTLLGIAAVIAAPAPLVLAPSPLILSLPKDRACLTWARRCDPANPGFRPPHLPARRMTG